MTRTADDFRELARLNHSGTHSCAGACLAEVIAAFEREAASPAALDVRRAVEEISGELSHYDLSDDPGYIKVPTERVRAILLARLSPSEGSGE